MCRKELDKLRELITVTIQEKINDKNLAVSNILTNFAVSN